MQLSSPVTVQRIPIDKIWPAPHIARQHHGQQKLQTLSQFMNGFGLLDPIRVRLVEDHYELVAGNRRWRAAKLLGWRSIDACVEDAASLVPSRRSGDH